MVYMYLSITPSFARRQGERWTANPSFLPHCHEFFCRISAAAAGPLRDENPLKIKCAAAASLIINHPQFHRHCGRSLAAVRPQSGRPLDYESTAERPQNECA